MDTPGCACDTPAVPRRQPAGPASPSARGPPWPAAGPGVRLALTPPRPAAHPGPPTPAVTCATGRGRRRGPAGRDVGVQACPGAYGRTAVPTWVRSAVPRQGVRRHDRFPDRSASRRNRPAATATCSAGTENIPGRSYVRDLTSRQLPDIRIIRRGTAARRPMPGSATVALCTQEVRSGPHETPGHADRPRRPATGTSTGGLSPASPPAYLPHRIQPVTRSGPRRQHQGPSSLVARLYSRAWMIRGSG
jgi:hypothetical protein